MAIRLSVEDEQSVNFKAQPDGVNFDIYSGVPATDLEATVDEVNFTVASGEPIFPDSYKGRSTITPTEEVQTLPTKGLMMTSDVIVNPIPKNYGLITYNGSTITIS